MRWDIALVVEPHTGWNAIGEIRGVFGLTGSDTRCIAIVEVPASDFAYRMGGRFVVGLLNDDGTLSGAHRPTMDAADRALARLAEGIASGPGRLYANGVEVLRCTNGVFEVLP